MRTFKTIAFGIAALGLATSSAVSAAGETSTRSSSAVLADGAKMDSIELSRGSEAAADSQQFLNGVPIWLIILALIAFGIGLYELVKNDSKG